MHFVHDQGYLGVFLMMAVESTVFPLPSELVVPPAAYWAAQGSFTFWGVVLAATLGSWFGQEVLGSDPRLLTEPDALVHALKAKLAWLVVGALVLLLGYVGVDLAGRRWRRADVRG